MCQFFSFLSDGNGNYYYADNSLRKKILSRDKLIPDWFENADSHSSLARYFIKNGSEDKLNAYEFNPLTKVFIKDKINTQDDSEDAETWVNKLDFKKVVPELIIKEIVNPFKLPMVTNVSHELILELKEWGSVVGSARDSVVGSARDSVWGSVVGSVWDSIRGSVLGSVRGSVWDSVRGSIWDSIRDSVGGYISSFFSIKYKYNFSSINKLWNKGLVPSFDGKLWRLHSGEKAKVVFKISKEKLEEYK